MRAEGGGAVSRSSVVGGIAVVGLLAAGWALVQAPSGPSSAAPGDSSGDLLGSLPGSVADLRLPDGDLLGFVEIPAGSFMMGSDPATDPAAFDIEWAGQPGDGGTPVELPTFYVSQTEVTVGQYMRFLDATEHAATQEATARPDGTARPSDAPVGFVSWPDALAYADWLTDQLLSLPDTPAQIAALLGGEWTVTLPTEAQWEKAARGEDGRLFPWGDEPPAGRAVIGAAGPAPVGSIPCPNCAYGLSDMAGNVWEWTKSPYQPYPYDESDDAETLGSDALWVMRGGSFADDLRMVRAANRGGADPGVRQAQIGFRLVISPG